jgi:PAS domain S-box-containing protein
MKNSLERRILIFSLLVLTLTVAVNTGFNVETFRLSYRDGILQRAQTLAESLKGQLEAIVNLGLSLDEVDDTSKNCQQIVQNDPEIAYCLVEDASGKVLYHSAADYPDPATVKYVGSLTPEVSILESPLMGKLYDFATPIHDYVDKVVGRVRIGFRDQILDDLVMAHLGSTVLILAASFVVVFALIVLFSRYDLVLPIRRLCGMAENLAAGKFDVDTPELKAREFAMLGDTMSGMANSLRERDEELKSNYRELEKTNLELQLSYENLESLSHELGHSREMYRSLLDDASDAILVCDDDDILIANKAAERFFGLPKSRMENNSYFVFLERIKCRDAEQQFEQHKQAQTGLSTTTEIRFWRDSDQRSLLGRASTSAVVGKDGRRLLQIIIRDATREEEVRLGLERAATEMERLNQMKNSFLGLASHELKTPLTIIMGYVELLLSDREQPLDEESLDLVRHIAKASDRLSEIIRDMVDVSLIDNQTIEFVSQDVDINVLAHRAVDKSESFIMQRGQTLTLDLGSDLPPIKCDVDRMIQAISNVLGNAIKFTPDKGRIILRTRLTHHPRLPERFSSLSGNNTCAISDEMVPYVEVSVCDNGIGIAESEQEAIFDKFYEIGDVKEHSTGKVTFKGRGAGLGLSVVKGIVDLHGGAVWVESPGHNPKTMPGSTFYILLPVAKPESSTAA